MSYLSSPLVFKNPNGPAWVSIVGRVSTVQQNIENIEASYRYVEDYLQRIHQGPMEIKHLGEQTSGMRTDRLTIIEAEEEIATGKWDLVITEDLSRFYRNPRHQYAFVQDARGSRHPGHLYWGQSRHGRRKLGSHNGSRRAPPWLAHLRHSAPRSPHG